MKIIGIDPGLARLGWSVLEGSPQGVELVQYGCLETSAKLPLTKRLEEVYDQLKELMHNHRPTVLALETLFFVKNAKTLAQVGHSRGVILLAAGQFNLDVYEYAPRQIKMALTGFGGAEKHQMQNMIQRLLQLKEIPKPDDAADAVAVALCHAQYAQTMGKSSVTV
ncbi:MAG: Crossover junction endodeoxyribonuclease RuvC [Elusimicrobia bacterium]|nr:Crossover junction endodeoxyribonuclease RuvC [Elusimicrobiota bacterium]